MWQSACFGSPHAREHAWYHGTVLICSAFGLQAAERSEQWATGTPQFMAIHTLMKRNQDLSSELESLLYVLLHIATGGRLLWKMYRNDQREAYAVKLTAMAVEFEDQILTRIESPLLKAAAIHLQELFFPGNLYYPRVKVTVQAFQRALETASASHSSGSLAD